MLLRTWIKACLQCLLNLQWPLSALDILVLIFFPSFLSDVFFLAFKNHCVYNYVMNNYITELKVVFLNALQFSFLLIVLQHWSFQQCSRKQMITKVQLTFLLEFYYGLGLYSFNLSMLASSGNLYSAINVLCFTAVSLLYCKIVIFRF